MSEETLSFQTEVAKLLRLMVNSVYSDKEVFLRELISNASDACDKARYLALTEPEILGDDPDFKVHIRVDKAARTLFLSDNGIGMDRDGLIATWAPLRGRAHLRSWKTCPAMPPKICR